MLYFASDVAMDCSLLPSVVAANIRTENTGQCKRKLRQSLPKVFLLVSKQPTYMIHGAVLFCACLSVGREIEHCFTIGGYAILEKEVEVTKTMSRYRSIVFSLAADVEASVRRMQTVPGGTLNEHFSAFANQSWRCWIIESTVIQQMRSGAAVPYVKVQPTYARLIGVEPTITDSIASHFDTPSELDPLELDESGSSVEPALQHPSGAAPNVQSFYIPAVADVSRATSHLRSLATMRDKGSCPHVYSPEVVLSCLNLYSNMKPAASINNVLGHAATLFFGRLEAAPLVSELASGDIKLPSPKLLQEARLRLDILSMLYERKQFLRFNYWRYLNPDSSPQLGFQWMVCREDRFVLPASTCSNLLAYMGLDLNACFETCLMSLSTYGRSRGTLVQKHGAILRHHGMVTKNAADKWTRCGQVKSVCSDMGTEKGINRGSTMTEEDGSLDRRAYPNSIYMPDHLHIFNNALASSVKRLPEYESFLVRLRAIENFLNERSLRTLYQFTCLQGHPAFALFSTHQRVHIDWRFEFLGPALEALVPKYIVMKATYDAQRLANSPDGKVETALIKEAELTINDPFFEEKCEMLMAQGYIIDINVHRLEGCFCHGHIWKSKKSWAQKTQWLQRESGYSKCFWKSRTGSWFQVVGFDLLIGEIEEGKGKTNRFQCLLDVCPEAGRAQLLEMERKLKQSLVEEFREKLAFHFEPEVGAIGVFYGETPGGDHELARAWCRMMCSKYDSAIAAGHGAAFTHNVHEIYSKYGQCRAGLDAFSNGTVARLKDAPVSFVAIQSVALSSLTGRAVEKMHALIKRIGNMSTNLSPPFVCALLKSPENMVRLNSDSEFYEFVVRHWRSRKLLTDVLRETPPDDLALLSRVEKIRRVYQCSLADEYRDNAKENASHKTWLLALKANVPAPVDYGRIVNTCIAFLKSKLVRGAVYSLPLDIFERCRSGEHVLPAELVGDASFQAVLNTVDAPSKEFDMSAARGGSVRARNRATIWTAYGFDLGPNDGAWGPCWNHWGPPIGANLRPHFWGQN